VTADSGAALRGSHVTITLSVDVPGHTVASSALVVAAEHMHVPAKQRRRLLEVYAARMVGALPDWLIAADDL